MKRLFKVLLKIIGGFLIVVLVTFGVLYLVYNKPLPTGDVGREADYLAHKMLKAVNNVSYQNTRYISWTFDAASHQYKWDKTANKVTVQWNDYKVILNLNAVSQSDVWNKGAEVFGEDKTRLIEKATDYFNNDSFWLVAPFKVFDKGTSRSLVTLEDGSKGLLVTYNTGGSTPGDAYLWKLLPNGFPESFQMWVQVIPIGGLEATWEDWKIMESGVFLPTSHKMGPVTLYLKDVKAYN